MVIGQITRGQTGIKTNDMQIDVQCASILLDIILEKNGFIYAHSGVTKAAHGLVAYYWYSDKLFKISAIGAPKWEPEALPYIFIEFDDPKLAMKLIATINIDENTDEKMMDAFVETVVSEIEKVLSGKENQEMISYG